MIHLACTLLYLLSVILVSACSSASNVPLKSNVKEPPASLSNIDNRCLQTDFANNVVPIADLASNPYCEVDNYAISKRIFLLGTDHGQQLSFVYMQMRGEIAMLQMLKDSPSKEDLVQKKELAAAIEWSKMLDEYFHQAKFNFIDSFSETIRRRDCVQIDTLGMIFAQGYWCGLLNGDVGGKAYFIRGFSRACNHFPREHLKGALMASCEVVAEEHFYNTIVPEYTQKKIEYYKRPSS